jgi:hypothetical protein
MEICEGTATLRANRAASAVPAAFYYVVSILSLGVLASCGAPGEPSVRRAPVPEAVTDLAVEQVGDDLILTFTLPQHSAFHAPLSKTPELDIYLDFAPATPSSAPPPPPRDLLTAIPPQLVDRYLRGAQVRFVDTFKPEELAQHASQQAVFAVRSRVSGRKLSDDSNLAVLRAYPPPEPIRDATAVVAHDAIILHWTPPQKTTNGENVPPITSYRVYRMEQEKTETASGGAAESAAESNAEAFKLIGEPLTPSFNDSQFEFGKTYVYAIRSVARVGPDLVASADSNLVTVTPKNVFPPPAPRGLEAVYVPAEAGIAAHIELSWDINVETDISGYNVYRSEGGSAPQRLNPQPLLTPAFRDMSGVPGRPYTYTVTAVDKAGNESAASSPASAEVPE